MTLRPPVADHTHHQLRVHLRDEHDEDTRGWTWLELVTLHDRKHRLGAEHDHERVADSLFDQEPSQPIVDEAAL